MPEAHGTTYEFYPGAPKYWKRSYTTTQFPEVQQLEPNVTVFTPQFDGLKIYGWSCKSPFPEDDAVEKRAFDRGMVMGFCFSEVVPDGEYGSTPLAEVVEISEDEFNQAKERGWK